jgi:hypothetical protein
MYYMLAQQAAASQPYWLVLVLALFASGSITALLNYWFNKRKTHAEVEKVDADAADIIQHAAGELIEKVRVQSALSDKRYQEQNQTLIEQNAKMALQLDDLQVQVAKIPHLEASIADLRIGIQMLTDQLKDNGIHPVYPPGPPPF